MNHKYEYEVLSDNAIDMIFNGKVSQKMPLILMLIFYLRFLIKTNLFFLFFIFVMSIIHLY